MNRFDIEEVQYIIAKRYHKDIQEWRELHGDKIYLKPRELPRTMRNDNRTSEELLITKKRLCDGGKKGIKVVNYSGWVGDGR